MTAPNPSTVVDEYARVATWTVTETGNVARGVADAIDNGTYDANTYANALGKLASIALGSWLGCVNATLNAAGGGTTPLPGPRIVTTDISVPSSTADRAVFVHTPFSAGGGAEIPSARITITPSTLPAGGTVVTITVDATDLPGGFYPGTLGLGPQTSPDLVDAAISL
jgi:hypothetical protein